MLSTGIERRESSPNEHQQNGKVERYVRIMEEQVASMRAAAPWVPKKFVTLQILLWVHIWNLQSGENESISRKVIVLRCRSSVCKLLYPGDALIFA